MIRIVLRRLLALLPLLLGVSLLSFLLLEASQGDYFSQLLEDPQVSQEQVELLRQQFGLDGPLPQRYLLWLGNALRGELGHSFRFQLPVSVLLAERLGNTLLLALSALLGAWGLALPLALWGARQPGGALDRGLGLAAALGASTPRVLLALVALLFAARSGWFPVGGLQDPLRWEQLGTLGKALDLARHLVLPASVLALSHAALLLRPLRAAFVEELGQDYVRAARAKGLSEPAILRRHVLRNAANPLLGLLGQDLGALLSGSFLVEVVFAWPGLARLGLDALLGKDVFLVLGTTLLATLALVLGNLVADLLLLAADPRVRLR